MRASGWGGVAWLAACALGLACGGAVAGGGGSAAPAGASVAAEASSFTERSRQVVATVPKPPPPGNWSVFVTGSVPLQPRYMHSAVELGGLVYVIGGLCGCSNVGYDPVARVIAYDRSTNTWSLRASMITPRFMLAVTVLNGHIFAIGGVDRRGVDMTSVEEYDPVADTWTARAPLSVARRYLTAATVRENPRRRRRLGRQLPPGVQHRLRHRRGVRPCVEHMVCGSADAHAPCRPRGDGHE